MSFGRSQNAFWSRTGDAGRIAVGTLIVIFIGYAGIVFGPLTGLSYFWPFGGVWAALGWGASRVSMKPVAALIILGLVQDFMMDAPVGCWVAVHLVAYLVTSVFLRRAQTDQSGFVRLLGDLAALVSAFIFARWVISSYLGGMELKEIMGGFLSTALLYLLVRPIFLLQREDWVGS